MTIDRFNVALGTSPEETACVIALLNNQGELFLFAYRDDAQSRRSMLYHLWQTALNVELDFSFDNAIAAGKIIKEQQNERHEASDNL